MGGTRFTVGEAATWQPSKDNSDCFGPASILPPSGTSLGFLVSLVSWPLGFAAFGLFGWLA